MVDPHKVWYVRPRTGGEFGPADGPLMKRWIEEGRVAGDSLVWCEGWDDWKNAALVFAELANHSPPAIVPSSTERIVISDAHVVSHPGEPAAGAGSSHPVGTSAQQVETPAGNSEPRPGLPRRRPDLGRRAATVVVLSIVAIVLLIVLIKVVVDAT